MIQLIGTKRLMIIAILAAICGVLGAITYLYLMPENQKLQSELQGVKSQIAQKRSDITRFRQEFDEIEAEKGRFQSLEALGFLTDQNRAAAHKRMAEIQSYSRVLAAKFDIDQVSVEVPETVQESDMVVLKSPVDITIEALDDADVYQFLYLLDNAFIGHSDIRSIELERILDLNEITLRQIGSGMPAVLVRAKVNFDWRTLVKKDLVPGVPVPGAEGL